MTGLRVLASAVFLSLSAWPASAQEGCGDLRTCLRPLAGEVAQILSREASSRGERLQVSFRPAYMAPLGVTIYCRALSMGLRNALNEEVGDVRDGFRLDFDVRPAPRSRVSPPEVAAMWEWERDRAALALEVHVALPEGLERRASGRIPAAALSRGERACLFSFAAGERRIEAEGPGVLREEPTFRADAEVAEYERGAELRVLGRIEAVDGSGVVWSVVAWRDPETRERRNLFATGLGGGVDDVPPPPPDPDPPYVVAEKSLGLSREDRVLVQRGLESAGGSVGPADGIFGPLTRAALRAWQEKRGLTSTGYLTRDQADALVALGRDAPPPPPPPEPDPVLKVGDVFRDCVDCPEMVVVPSGRFMMGSPPSEEGRYDWEEGPVHRVSIPSVFAVGVYEVTFEEWDACVSAGGCGGYRPGDRGWGRGQRPVINVSWDDARAYVDWLSGETGEAYRLLSEAEWEYVARAGTRTRYHWGDAIGRNRANCDGCGSRWDGGKSTSPVGSFGANAFGLHDVHGNVFEWVEDCYYDSYAGAPRDGSAWKGGDCSFRVLRGGSWSYVPRDLRAASRFWYDSGDRNHNVGFRVARTFTP